jgi:HlyD family secretion protein
MQRRQIPLLLLAVAAAAILVVNFWPAPQRLTLTGIVTTDNVLVSSEIGGRIQRLAVNVGDTVKAGQILGAIQPPEYAADVAYFHSTAALAKTQIAQAQADLRFQKAQSAAQIAQGQANLAAARAQSAAAAADLENASLAFGRARELRARGTNAVQEFDQARTAQAAAAARADASAKQAEAAESALRLAEATGEETAARQAAVQAAIDQAGAAGAQEDKARVRLGYTQIHSPSDGIVDFRAAREGEVVTPGQPIVSLVNLDDLWVRVDVEETYIDRIRIGDKVPVRLPSGDRRDGVVFYRAADADFATQRDVSRTKRDVRTFEIRLRCDNRDRALAVGMTAYVTLPVGPR